MRAITRGVSKAKQANAALHKFEAPGWINKGYRAVVISDLQALIQFGEQPETARLVEPSAALPDWRLIGGTK